MDPKPVQHYATPRYPTRRDLMLGAAGFVLIDLLGGEAQAAESDKPAAGRTVVAPIFKHGEGRGATGCVVLAPAVFLSEEEAIQIIREELAKHGVKLVGGIRPRSAQTMPTFEDLSHQGPGKTVLEQRAREYKGPIHPEELEAVDRAKKVAVRYVSRNTEDRLRKVKWMGTVGAYDLSETAERIAAELKKGTAELFVGVFYDPSDDFDSFGALEDGGSAVKSDKELEALVAAWEARSKAKAVESLRQQTRDFAAWLKQRKVL